MAGTIGASVGGATYIDKVLGYGPIAYWPLYETSGTTAACLVNAAQNGTYNSDVSGWPVGDGVGDGNTAPLFDGSNDCVNVYSATLNANFDGQEGAFAGWMRAFNAGVWTDGAWRTTALFLVDFSNYIQIHRTNANNQYQWWYNAGGVGDSITDVSAAGRTDWIHFAMTWSRSADELKAYFDGVQAGATQATLGIWAGNLSNTRCVLGANDLVTNEVWHGWLAHCAIWDTVLTQPQLLDLATV